MGEGRGAISRRPLAEAVQVEGQHFGPVTLVIEACEGAPGNSGVGPSYEDPKALVDSGTLGLLGVWGSEDPEVLVDSGWPWGSLGSDPVPVQGPAQSRVLGELARRVWLLLPKTSPEALGF